MMGAERFDRYYEAQGSAGDEVFTPETEFETEEISLSGSARAASVNARSVKISGSAAVTGEIRSGTLGCSGSVHAGGNVKSAEIKVSGSFETGGSISSMNCHVSGSCRVGSAVRAETLLSVSGSLSAAAASSGRRVEILGSINADTLSAPEVEIEGGGKVGTLSCRNAVINMHGKNGRLINRLAGRGRSMLTVEKIEAEGEVTVDRCIVGTLSAGTVKIGRDCRVRSVTYTEACTAEKGAEVGSSTRRA